MVTAPLPSVGIVPTSHLVVAASARVRPGTYLLRGEGATPALTVRGDGITVDFTGVVLRGTPATAMPDARKGIGLLVEGRNVTIRGLHAHGYKLAVLARQAPGVRLVDCDLSYNWRQRLRSTPEREDEADWMSFHHNERGEWLDQGAGAYLDRCDGFEVRGLRVTGGQSGLLVNRCDGGRVWNCDLSFNSALGLGMYRSSRNRIMHNRMDYDVRGFSFGVYNRGQDSAGVLVFEGCRGNLFAYNSATHGGDGFFLWAGQTTMDTGEGGCDDNLVYANDFSYAVTNGIEATFSRNVFVGNRVRQAANGAWLGYSHDSKLVGNDFYEDRVGVAIEHGGANEIAFNRFQSQTPAVSLWADPPDPAFEYAKRRDVRSRDNRIVGNVFWRNPVALDLRDTTNTLLDGNVFVFPDTFVERSPGGDPFSPLPVTNEAYGGAGLPGRVVDSEHGLFLGTFWDALDPAPNGVPGAKEAVDAYRVAPLPGGRMPFLPEATRGLFQGVDLEAAPRGWNLIRIDEWGPYDFRRPLLAPAQTWNRVPFAPIGPPSGNGIRTPAKPQPSGLYGILGPKGRWRLVSAEGATLGATNGVVPGSVAIRVPSDRFGRTKIELEYVGTATTDVRGIVTPAGKPVRFGLSRFDAPIDWTVRFFRWTESVDPKDPHAAPKSPGPFAGTPLRTLRTERLDFAGAAFLPGLPGDHTATLAEGSFAVPAGDYVIDLTADDGARAWLDGKPLIEDAWHYQGPTPYARTVHLAGGAHRLRVEHFQIDGYAALRLSIRPKSR